MRGPQRSKTNSGPSVWKIVLISTIGVAMVVLLYLSNHVSNQMQLQNAGQSGEAEATKDDAAQFGRVIGSLIQPTPLTHVEKVTNTAHDTLVRDLEAKRKNEVQTTTTTTTMASATGDLYKRKVQQPVKGDIPTNGVKPLYGRKHKGTDAIFALATNYPKLYYERFVGSLRKAGYTDDIVLSVSPPEKMKPGVAEYLQQTDVVAYGFDVDCEGKDNCKLQNEFLGYPDPRPMRTFANIRYALYEYWLQHYSAQSYILILDFRDTFFQANPFQPFGALATRSPKYELQVFEENSDVKNIGKCVFNSLWVSRCFGKEALEGIKSRPVLCSGSTLGSYDAIHYYVRTMLSSMDEVKCWLKGIESDQGYQNYLFYSGKFNVTGGTTTAFRQGTGVVNTIGAMNGHRVPKDQKGPLDTFWKARDSDGYIINRDGSRSACVHQWDRWYKDLNRWVDSTLF